MNPQGMAVIQAARSIDDPFSLWVRLGHDLLTQRTAIEWQLADWIADGSTQFGHQVDFAFLAEDLGIAPKELKSAARVAAVFPAHLRDSALTYQHHESVANLPPPDALAVLKEAKAQHWDDRETRVEAVRRKAQIEQATLLTDDDWEHHELMAITRAWNRARSSVREEFYEMAGESQLGTIDA